MREIEDGFIAGDERCVLAMNMYINRIVKYIWSYTALMWGVDVITFTAGVLENSSVMRELLVNKLWFLSLKLDKSVNDFRGQERVISTQDSQVIVAVIPTNEELVIAQDAYRLSE
jgi:acetate kinase